MISEICGITPEQCTLRLKISAYRPRETTPSWIRAPPPSLMPTTGRPERSAKSRILTIFSPYTSPSEPPYTATSWENTQISRPSTVPYPVTTPSPYGRFRSSPKLVERCRANESNSTNEPGSSSRSMRSRAVSLPLACCRCTVASDPAWMCSSRRRSRAASLPAVVCGGPAGAEPVSLGGAPPAETSGPAISGASVVRLTGVRVPSPSCVQCHRETQFTVREPEYHSRRAVESSPTTRVRNRCRAASGGRTWPDAVPRGGGAKTREKVLVLGGNVGGLTAALTVRHELHGDVDVGEPRAGDPAVPRPPA